MAEKDESGFSWLSLFLVTGFSGLGFDLIIKLLDGYHSPILLWIGIIALSLGLLNFLISLIARKASNKKESRLGD
ncbi:MAG TPA: hypothetical protein PLU11_09180 [Chitinophagaceae bacterium]|nr:hypothetical protein [Chitinophagaceae bacterium]HPH31135.1 hypothetical protein [Chitinophagaceae bacterium]HPN59334.1 hypothetical protein [Chitinophagaceae bacterium]